jgi:hypothetical protein
VYLQFHHRDNQYAVIVNVLYLYNIEWAEFTTVCIILYKNRYWEANLVALIEGNSQVKHCVDNLILATSNLIKYLVKH